MYGKILVPLDGSKRAESILSHVEKLALQFESEVLLLTVITPEVLYRGSPDMLLDIPYAQENLELRIKEAETYLSGVEGEFRAKGISSRSAVEVGTVVSTIIDLAEKEGVDLIAMASHGRSGLSHVFYGSVAAGVLNRIRRPLLLVRAV
ncbi:MAG: universal stress protein [Anaerolineales bacterium]|nr:universal stress protein [Anaerolineales bacterium]